MSYKQRRKKTYEQGRRKKSTFYVVERGTPTGPRKKISRVPHDRHDLKSDLIAVSGDQAVNKILQNVVASQAISQPHIALMVEGLRRAYNHREFICDIAQEIGSDRSLGEKLQTIGERSAEEVRSEIARCLIQGGVQSISSYLTEQEFFTKPFGSKGPTLDEQSSRVFRSFFENSLSSIVESGRKS